MTTLRSCDGGHTCSPPKECCKQGCCYTQESVVYRSGTVPPSNMFAFVVGHWYFWAATTATLLGILCACSLWRRQSGGGPSFRNRDGGCYFCCYTISDAASSRITDEHVSEPDSNGSCYIPPQYSRCGSFHQAPPPYSEVASKPDLYPLVISYNGDALLKANSGSTGYLMVQYFRNFIVRPVGKCPLMPSNTALHTCYYPGTLSATSTIDSLSSSFICNAANEANNIIPPPYSRTGSLEEVSVVFNAASSLPQRVVTTTTPPTTSAALIPSSSNNVQCPAVIKKNETLRLREKLKPRPQQSVESESDEQNFSDLLNLSVCAPSMVTSNVIIAQSNPQMDIMYSGSVANSMTSSDISSLTNLGTPDSPPRATSPTLEMRELLDKIQQLPGSHKSPVSGDAPKLKKYFNSRAKAKTLYMPLTTTACGIKEERKSRGWMSRSAPTTPSSNFIPNFGATHSFAGAAGSAMRSGSQRSSRVKLSNFDGSPLLQEQIESDEDER